MIIHSMTATFGKLDHQTLTLESGLNIIDAPNEWGKSTWCAFIMAMLYGMDTRERSTKTALADKERYAPWSGVPMSGRMELEWQGRDITIERWTKGRIPMGEFRAYETQSGLPVAELTAANCGQRLVGVERSVFSRSGFIRGAQMPVEMNEELRGRLNALVTTADESREAEALGEKLKELKNRCRYNRSGLIPQACSRMETLEKQLGEYEALSTQVQSLEAQCRALEEQKQHQPDTDALEQAIRGEETARLRCQELERKCACLPDRETEINEVPQKNKKRTLLICAALCLAAALGLLAVSWVASCALAAVALGFLIGGILAKPQQVVKQEVSHYWEELAEARQALTLARQRLELVRGLEAPKVDMEALRRLHMRIGQCQGQMSAIGEPEVLRRELEQVRQRIQKLERTERALSLALSTLEQARAELQRRFAPGISRRAQELFARLTDGRYDRLTLGQELAALTGAEGEDTLHGVLWRSEGTADQLYLSLRLAVAQELTPNAPLVLDDALIRFDDRRLKLALGLLEELGEKKQVILFSCRQISDCV